MTPSYGIWCGYLHCSFLGIIVKRDLAKFTIPLETREPFGSLVGRRSISGRRDIRR
ncbi:hypothetical protein BDR03DRAFT_960780 [Suillus americanus]|nr:hypothetical protein BDR03DRAFT_960780 [Suillus americanus]